MRYEREIKRKILGNCRFFPILVLTGARQSGKTTLLREIFPTHTYVSLDIPADAELAELAPAEFLRRYPPPLLIDEVQYAPKLFRHLKVIVDEQREKAGQFILTGSQKFTLMKEVSDSLAGRALVVELENMSVHELGDSFFNTKLEKGINEVLVRGMFPELWKQIELPSGEYLRSYLASYIERDVRQILNISSLRDFDRFLRACAIRSGSLLNKDEIAREVGVTAKTVNQWLSVLQASNQISLLEPYFENLGKRLVKSPKLYFNDTGLLCFLLGLNKQNVLDSYMLGAIWETFVYAELRKYIGILRPEASLWFYRDQNSEIDFVIADGVRFQFLECKWNKQTDSKSTRIMIEIAKLMKNRQVSSYIVSHGEKALAQSHLGILSGFQLHALFETN